MLCIIWQGKHALLKYIEVKSASYVVLKSQVWESPWSWMLLTVCEGVPRCLRFKNVRNIIRYPIRMGAFHPVSEWGSSSLPATAFTVSFHSHTQCRKHSAVLSLCQPSHEPLVHPFCGSFTAPGGNHSMPVTPTGVTPLGLLPQRPLPNSPFALQTPPTAFVFPPGEYCKLLKFEFFIDEYCGTPYMGTRYIRTI